MDDVSWGALAAALTLVGGVYTWFAYQRRGLGAGLRGAGLTLLPVAAYLTRTLQLLGAVVDDVGSWATGLVFRPSVWVGVILAGVAVVVFGAGTAISRRTGPREVGGGAPSRGQVGGSPPTARAAKPARGKGTGDPELDEIEELLRKRGIS